MEQNKIRIAVPDGSLRSENRGNIGELFLTAGYDIVGYSPDVEWEKPLIRNDPEIELRTDRPQNMPMQMPRKYDAGILGADWNYETGGSLVEVCDLKAGWVKIVVAVKKEVAAGSIDELLMNSRGKTLICVSEYPFIAKDALMKSPAYLELYGNKKPVMNGDRGEKSGENEFLRIERSFGKTENTADGFADFIIETTQTGDGLARANMRIIDTVMESTARLYTTEATLSDAWKREKIEDIATLLMGAVATRQQQYVVAAMNIPLSSIEGFVGFLKEEGYCKKMPTVSIYGDNAAVEVVIPMAKYPLAVKQILKMGADDIINRNTGQIVTRMEFPSIYR
ncbi:hypothetical protein HYU11_03790 [Candidatus Woesearchaeota archaeon]|nr:hypothetical protein [Candidatus Woesearchaeota archaeon]